jgi:hypothetical protein
MPTDPRSVGELVSQIADGRRVKFLFFWGHQPEQNGDVVRGCLSQWWPAPFVVDDLTFATAEHYMMWRKAILFGDSNNADQILRTPNPDRAKMLGRGVHGFDQRRWEECRYEIVVAGNVAKFGQHRDLCQFLLRTAGHVIAEASPTDPIWGIGLSSDDPRAEHPEQWPGLNLLGFALTEARTILRKQSRSDTNCPSPTSTTSSQSTDRI